MNHLALDIQICTVLCVYKWFIRLSAGVPRFTHEHICVCVYSRPWKHRVKRHKEYRNLSIFWVDAMYLPPDVHAANVHVKKCVYMCVHNMHLGALWLMVFHLWEGLSRYSDQRAAPQCLTLSFVLSNHKALTSNTKTLWALRCVSGCSRDSPVALY